MAKKAFAIQDVGESGTGYVMWLGRAHDPDDAWRQAAAALGIDDEDLGWLEVVELTESDWRRISQPQLGGDGCDREVIHIVNKARARY